MKEFVERILFCLVCIQIGLVIVNMTDIRPGVSLGTGEVNNAWGGSLTNPVQASTQIQVSLSDVQSAVDRIGVYNEEPIPMFLGWSITGSQAAFIHQIESLLGAIGPLLSLCLEFIFMLISIIYILTIGSLGFYTNVFSIISKDNAPIYAIPIALMQMLLVIYYIATTLLEILGAKTKSVGTGGVAGQ